MIKKQINRNGIYFSYDRWDKGKKSGQLNLYKELRLDGHPTWDRSFKRICFQGAPNEFRQVFIADLKSLLS